MLFVALSRQAIRYCLRSTNIATEKWYGGQLWNPRKNVNEVEGCLNIVHGLMMQLANRGREANVLMLNANSRYFLEGYAMLGEYA
jgi:hypothetical protein